MKLRKRKISLDRKNYYNMYLPTETSPNICGIVTKSDVQIFADDNGYEVLSQLFKFSTKLINNEFIYIPVDFIPNEEFKNVFYDSFNDTNLSIIIVNYHCIQLNIKNILKLVNQKYFEENIVHINDYKNLDFDIDYWKIKSKLTVKKQNNCLFLYANNNIFSCMAESCFIMSKNTEKDNLFSHRHFDAFVNTYKSLGFTFRFWKKPNII